MPSTNGGNTNNIRTVSSNANGEWIVRDETFRPVQPRRATRNAQEQIEEMRRMMTYQVNVGAFGFQGGYMHYGGGIPVTATPDSAPIQPGQQETKPKAKKSKEARKPYSVKIEKPSGESKYYLVGKYLGEDIIEQDSFSNIKDAKEYFNYLYSYQAGREVINNVRDKKFSDLRGERFLGRLDIPNYRIDRRSRRPQDDIVGEEGLDVSDIISQEDSQEILMPELEIFEEELEAIEEFDELSF